MARLERCGTIFLPAEPGLLPGSRHDVGPPPDRPAETGRRLGLEGYVGWREARGREEGGGGRGEQGGRRGEGGGGERGGWSGEGGGEREEEKKEVHTRVIQHLWERGIVGVAYNVARN